MKTAKTAYIIIACAIAALAMPLHAEVLTLDECIAMAKRNNKSLRAADLQSQAAELNIKSIKGQFFPSISVTGTALYSDADGSYSMGPFDLPVKDLSGNFNGMSAYMPELPLEFELGFAYGGGIKLEQPIYMGGKISTGYRMAKTGHAIALQSRRLTEAEVIVKTSQAYADAVKARELREVALAYNTLLSELMRTVESAKRHGLKSQNDVLKVQVKLNDSELQLRRAENGLRLATMNLCHYIGRPLIDSISTANTLPDCDYTATATADIAERPEYQMLQGQTDIARHKIAMARADYLPQIGLVGQYGYFNGAKLNGRKLIDGGSWLVGVQLSIPIYDFGHRYNKIKAAKAQYAQAIAERDDTYEMLSLEIQQCVNNLDEAALELRLADASVASADENLRSSRRQYEAGVETLSDYLEAQTIWQQARQTQVEARINKYLRYLEYQKAAGIIN